MKNRMLSLLFIGLFSCGVALADIIIVDPPLTEVEVGGGVLASPQSVEFLFRITATGPTFEVNDYSSLVVAKIQTDVAGYSGSYIDMHFDLLNYKQEVGPWNFDAGLITGEFTRNIQVDNDLTYRVSLVGLKGQLTWDPLEDVSVYVNGAMDILGLGLSRRLSDNKEIRGGGSSFAGEVGAKIFNQVRIALGTSVGTVGAGSVDTGGYVLHCYDYGTRYDGGYHTCYPSRAYTYEKRAIVSSTYTSLVYSLSQSLSVFTKLGYNVYSYTDLSNQASNSSQGTWQFLLGAGQKF